VDGKLARVTVTSSRFGHYFDHIIDIVHPPIWYILWGIGLEVYKGGVFGLPLGPIIWLLMTGYIAGRLVEAAFTSGLGRFGIFCWRPVDSYFRLITARRNPCMILLTLGALAGRPDVGLLAVVLWTVLTSIFLLIRLTMAFFVRVRKGPLRSWLMDADRQSYRGSMAVRLFTRRMAGDNKS
jgi:phosphatidylglycerophosphate synthase